jgi:hypothetical protein
MSSLVIAGDTSGSVTLQAQTVAGSPVLTLPTTSGTILTTTGGVSPATAGNVLTADGTNWTSANKIVSGSVNAGGTNPFPSSGGPTSVDFTSIPSWVKRITVMLSAVSTSGTANSQIQLGTSGGIQTAGYLASLTGNTGTTSTTLATGGFEISQAANAAAVMNGSVIFTLLDSATGTWAAQGSLGFSNSARTSVIGGSKVLSGTLDRIRITTTGSDAFDAGSINILYE